VTLDVADIPLSGGLAACGKRVHREVRPGSRAEPDA